MVLIFFENPYEFVEIVIAFFKFSSPVIFPPFLRIIHQNLFTQIIRSMYTPKFFLSSVIFIVEVLSNVQPQTLWTLSKNYPALIQDEVHQLIRVIYCQLLCKAIMLCLE